jgi:hypothetical protein
MSNCTYHGRYHFSFTSTHPTSTDVIDPAGLDNPQYPWNIVNGAAGHYDGLDPINKTNPYYADVAFNT